MKIKLIAPRMSLRPMDSEFKRLMTPSISLLVLSALTPGEHTVQIHDENVRPLRYTGDIDLVGITCNVDTFPRAADISRRYRDLGVPVILGGIFPSACPERALEVADAVCVGEAEPLWGDILLDSRRGRLRRRYECRNGFPMRMVPRPNWEAVAATRYLYTNVVTTSRGCPHRCDFCYNSCDYTIKKFRRRPIDTVLAEIDRLDTRQVLFVDDNFIGDRRWLSGFLDEIAQRGATWHAAVSADIGRDLSLLDKMHATGCRSLYIGFESVNESSIREASKRQNRIEEYDRTIREIHDRGIMINASMVFGFDGDGPDVFDNTLQWLVRNRIETMTAHILTPYPGTVLYRRLQEQGRITDTNLAHYNTARVVFRPGNMSAEELRDGYLGIYRKFYSFANIWKRRPTHRSVLVPYFLFNFGYRKFGGIASQLGRLGLMASIGRLARRLSYGIG